MRRPDCGFDRFLRVSFTLVAQIIEQLTSEPLPSHHRPADAGGALSFQHHVPAAKERAALEAANQRLAAEAAGARAAKAQSEE